jgi:hypothetical protein
MSEQIEKIADIGKAAKKSLGDVAALEKPEIEPNKARFDSLMDQPIKPADTSVEPVVQASQKPTPIDQISNSNPAANSLSPSPQNIVAKTQEAINKIEKLKADLETPNARIKPEYKNLVNNKLVHINENIQIALSKAGVEYTPPAQATTATASPANPIERFLGYLTDGQYRLQHLSDEVEAMHANRQEISPAAMLAVQIKVGYVTQELTFFSGMLSKSLDSIKTLMNVQV